MNTETEKSPPEKHIVASTNALLYWEWIHNRGGVAVWCSVNLSNPGASWSTPALTEKGDPMSKPTWEADSKPERVITDPADVSVRTYREVKRFHVGIKRGSGLQLTLTSGASRRLEKELGKAGPDASYEFDYECQDALIMVPDETIPLPEWVARSKESAREAT